MLSVSKPFKGAGRADYYLNLAREDYYLNGNEPPGRWLGEGSVAFDLPAIVAGDDFRNLLAGFGPDGKEALVHNAGSHYRRSGWDLTWSVPKSVSVAWSQASPEVRQVIEDEVWSSVHRAICYVEAIGVVSRRGTNGVVHEAAKLTFAGFLHSTSRAQDPQLHIHTILLNVGFRPDGSTGTLDPRAIYRHQLAAGALFRAELAARLEQRLGLRARREGRCFEILGVDMELMAEFSKRRAQIEKHLLELGLTGPEASEKAAFDTRASKVTLPRSVLFARWRDIGEAHHWSTRQLNLLLHAPFPARNRVQEIELATQAALQALTQSDSHFSARQLVQSLAEEAQGRGLNADDVLALRQQLLTSPKVVPLQECIYEPRWTTPEMLALEKNVLETTHSMRQRERSRFDFDHLVNDVLQRHSHLSDEQRTALSHVVCSEGGIRVVTGMAGTGKSSLFRAANEIWMAQGRQVHGACLAGKAAQELTQAAGIPAQTLQRLLLDLKHRRIGLDRRSVLLVDEAGMVGTRQMKMLFDYALSSGASIVLCGDGLRGWPAPVEMGASQSDLAHLHAEDVDWEARIICFVRMKTRWRGQQPPQIRFGKEVEEILASLPKLGPLFPYLATVRAGDRATEFKQRCVGLGIHGVSLHSYRYAWAERAKTAGYPERFAQLALGHNSKAVHRAYAKKAQVTLPPLEEYEQLQREQKVIPLRIQNGAPGVLAPQKNELRPSQSFAREVNR